jgi:hypothetical protein
MRVLTGILGMKLELYFNAASKLLLQENMKSKFSDFQVPLSPFKSLISTLCSALLLRIRQDRKTAFQNCVCHDKHGNYCVAFLFLCVCVFFFYPLIL